MARHLKSELSEMIISRIPLLRGELSQVAPKELFQMAYAALEGIREAGNNAGKWVEMIQYTVGLNRGDAWCMATAQTAIRFVELQTRIDSKLFASGHCLTVFANSKECQVTKPEQGDLIIYQHGKTQSGHVEGIIDLYKDRFAFTMGGNTSSGPGVSTEGDGVFFRMRSLSSPGGDLSIKGFLRPFA